MGIKFNTLLSLIVCLTGILSCDKSTPAPSSNNGNTNTGTPPLVDDFFTAYYDLTSLPISADFESAKVLGTVQNPSLNEISGIASAHALPGTLWSEEDSGNENSVYLMKTSGEFLGTVRLTSITNRDWEDLAIAPGPQASINYIYLAEIGDNNKVNSEKYIFRFPEPVVSNSSFPFSMTVNAVDKISFSYPDGNKNAEAVMVDPLTKDIYVVSKEDQGAVIYVAKYPQDISKAFVMTKIGVLPISTVTAADISPDGSEVLIKNYNVTLYWKKTSNETIPELLKKTPVKAPYQIEEKGESICWANDGTGYFTTSELPGQPIYFYKRK